MYQEDTEYIVPAAGKYGMTELHHAAYLNDPDYVRAQLQRGISVDVRDDAGWTPLHWSIDMSQAWGEPEEVVSILIAAGASVNATSNTGFSVLMTACGRNNENILDQLINSGVDIHLRNAETSPLHEAAGCNFSEAIRKLILLGADSSEKDANDRTPEQLARFCEFEESVIVFRELKYVAKHNKSEEPIRNPGSGS